MDILQGFGRLTALDRRGLYSNATRLEAISLIARRWMMHDYSTHLLMRTLVKWPRIEISLFLYDFIRCLPDPRCDFTGSPCMSKILIACVSLHRLNPMQRGELHDTVRRSLSSLPDPVAVTDGFMRLVTMLLSKGSSASQAVIDVGMFEVLFLLADPNHPLELKFANGNARSFVPHWLLLLIFI